MKRTVALLLCLLTLFSVFVFTSCGKCVCTNSLGEGLLLHDMNDKEYKGYSGNPMDLYIGFRKKYKISDDSLILEITEDASGKIEIPSEHNGKKIVAVVGGSVGKQNKKITELVIPDSVYFVNGLNFPSLKSLKIGSNVKYINESFDYCESLTSLTLPKCEVKSSFRDCEKLKTLSFPKGMESIRNCFSGCSSLESVELKGLSELVGSFNSCPSLEKVGFGGRIETFYASFRDCEKLSAKLNNYDFSKNKTVKKITEDSKIIFYNEMTQKYEYAFEAQEFVRYNENGKLLCSWFAMSPEEADVVISYGEFYVEQLGEWVKEYSDEKVRDAYVQKVDCKFCSCDGKFTTIESYSLWEEDSGIREDNIQQQEERIKDKRAAENSKMMSQLESKFNALISEEKTN